MAVREANRIEMPSNSGSKSDLVVIGAGPAGLTAAVEAGRLGFRTVVVEKHSIVGGLARTESYKGFLFDLGGHRFFTKVQWVEDWWREMLGEDFLRRPRLSRIFYGNTFFSYPPNFLNAVAGLGLIEGIRIAFSYVKAQLFPTRPVITFEDWVSNNFGNRLFSIFFESYTEKVWGLSCRVLRAEWAAQRIKNMSLRTIIQSMLLKTRRNVTSLIEEFDYPRLGPGMMWRAAADRVEQGGGQVLINTELVRLQHSGRRVTRAIVRAGETFRTIDADAFISTLPLPELISRLEPAPPTGVGEAAAQLRFRDFLTVCLVVDATSLFPDNWIYVHEPKVKVARIQNFKNWSPHMLPDQSKTSLGMEYFCNRNDAVWNMTDTDLVKLAAEELVAIGLVDNVTIVTDGCVFRVPDAYPIYDEEYASAVDAIREYLDTFENLRTAGRNGLHRYNNQDHSMLAGHLAARDLLLAERADLWSLNTEEDYQEQKTELKDQTPRESGLASAASFKTTVG